MIRIVEETRQQPGFDKHNSRAMAKMITRTMERRFDTTFDSIAAEADFAWKTQKFNGRVSKLYLGGYSALSFQSSPDPPPASDFVDVVGYTGK